MLSSSYNDQDLKLFIVGYLSKKPFHCRIKVFQLNTYLLKVIHILRGFFLKFFGDISLRVKPVREVLHEFCN